MNRMSLRTLLLSLLAALVLAGCQSTGDAEVAPEPEVQEAPAEAAPAAPPMVTPAPRPVTNDEGFPLDASGRPIGYVFYFEFDRTELTPRARALLAEHAEYLKENGSVRITIQGHADERGTREYNLALGERRAQSISAILIAAGVNARQIEEVSYGEEQLADPANTSRAWALNRRAVVSYR